MTMLFFDPLLIYLRIFIGMIGVVVIMFGALRGLRQLFLAISTREFHPNFIRLEFGNCVILGLEFMVGADIIGSLVQPDYYNLGLLGIIVIIRTVLSYFLNQELDALSPKKRKTIK